MHDLRRIGKRILDAIKLGLSQPLPDVFPTTPYFDTHTLTTLVISIFLLWIWFCKSLFVTFVMSVCLRNESLWTPMGQRGHALPFAFVFCMCIFRWTCSSFQNLLERISGSQLIPMSLIKCNLRVWVHHHNAFSKHLWQLVIATFLNKIKMDRRWDASGHWGWWWRLCVRDVAMIEIYF